MDAKDLRSETTLSDRNEDGNKYTSSSASLRCNRNKSYQEIGSNSLGKVDVTTSRPCAVIGPDRVVPPISNDVYLKKPSVDAWPSADNGYRRPPEYSHKISNYQNPTRNISPRQTFQENMQRTMMPPTYNSLKISDNVNYAQNLDRNVIPPKSNNSSMPAEVKYCDVPYSVNPMTNEQKNIRNPEMCVSSVNPVLSRTAPHAWSPSNINIHHSRPYGAPDLYQYPEYAVNYAGPRPVHMPRAHRTAQEEPGYVYLDPYYQDANIRFKPYPPPRERFPHSRYEYNNNYPGPFPLPPFPHHKYDVQKAMPPHPYSPYPSLKYMDNRISDPTLEGYPRQTNPQSSFNAAFHNQLVHPSYGPMIGNSSQNKTHSFSPEGSGKTIASNKPPYDNHNKVFIEYDHVPKMYPQPENFFASEMSRDKNQIVLPNYSSINMQAMPPHPYYKKDNTPLKTYECAPHFRNMEPSINTNSLLSTLRHPLQFSPNSVAISPTDSNTSIDTTHTQGTSQEDCGYVSQSSSASIRSIELGMNRQLNDYRVRHDYRYGPVVRRTPPLYSKADLISNRNMTLKDKRNINVRQFLQMWNEGDDEGNENNTITETVSQKRSNNIFSKKPEVVMSQEQLYVLGSVTVPNEELSKYEHIQKVSKLPDNIKGYNNIELLNQFEEAIKSSNINSFKQHVNRDSSATLRSNLSKQLSASLPRPISPLDVEAKISQSIIHKEVGCNFEIKPCSPKMINAEVATPAQAVLGERLIEKVSNTLTVNTTLLNGLNDGMDSCNIMKNQNHRMLLNTNTKVPSCKMINSQFITTNSTESIKPNYTLQDLESNSGVCLASLPRLDNDIELNFPEVNQQFINANKGESHIPTQLKDLPALETEQPDKLVCKNSLQKISEIVQDLPPVGETEKEFAKLSKYRKNRSYASEAKDNLQLNVNAIRTDSVIIKNPENVNNYDTDTHEMQQVPINLTSQGNDLNEEQNKNNFDALLNSNDDENNSSYGDIVINFSLNKNHTGSPKNYSVPDIHKVHQLSLDVINGSNTTNILGSDNNNAADVILPDKSDEHSESSDISSKINDSLSSSIIQYKEETRKIKKESYTFNKFPNIDNKDITIHSSASTKIESYPTDISKNATVTLEDSKGLQDIAQSMPICDTKYSNSKVDTHDKNYAYDNGFVYSKDITAHSLVSDKIESNLTIVSSETVVPSAKAEGLQEITESMTAYDTKFENSSEEVNNHDNKDAYVNKVLNKDSNVIPQSFVSRKIVSDLSIVLKDAAITSEDTKGFQKNTENRPPCDTKLNNSSEIISGEKYAIKEKEADNCNKKDEYKSVLCNEIIVCDTKTFLIQDNKSQQNNYIGDGFGKEHHLAGIDHQSTIEYLDKPVSLAEDVIKEPVSDFYKASKSPNLKLHFENKTGSDILLSPETEQNNPDITSKNQDTQNNVESQKNRSIYNTKIGINMHKVLHYSRKELFSPWIQKLILYNEGLCSNNFTCKSYSKPDDNILSEMYVESLVCEHIIANHKDIETCKKREIDIDYNVTDVINITSINKNSHKDEIENRIERTVFDSTDHVESKFSTEENKCEDVKMSSLPLNTLLEVNIQENNESVNSNSTSITDCNESPYIAYKVALNDTNIGDFKPESKNNNDVVPETHLGSNLTVKNCGGEVKDKDDINDTIFYKINTHALQSNINLNRSNCHVSLKRSMSDSALNVFDNTLQNVNEKDSVNNMTLIWPYKRKKVNDLNSHLFAENVCNLIQNTRRNSISSINTEENVSFCILIDNDCVITEGNDDEEKDCFTDLTQGFSTEIEENCLNEEQHSEIIMENIYNPMETEYDYSDSFILEEEKSISESWVENVACVETVISDDIAEDIVISASSSPKNTDLTDYDESGIFSSSANEHTDKVKYIYGDIMCSDDAQLVDTLYRTPQMNVNETLVHKESQVTEEQNIYYDKDSLENILSEPNGRSSPNGALNHYDSMISGATLNYVRKINNKEEDDVTISPLDSKDMCINTIPNVESENVAQNNIDAVLIHKNPQDDTVHSCESSIDNVFSYNHLDENTDSFEAGSITSPEVSSTTSEEKKSSLLLKRSKISQMNDSFNHKSKANCKFTEVNHYSSSNSKSTTTRPLLTKGAQKYIPPLKESIGDLKVKLALPQQKLIKLKQMKMSKAELKINYHRNAIPRTPVKLKPKFEDVLKSIDEIQIKNHKEKTKKVRKAIPKMVIKKNLNGSHYTSTSSKDIYNPDLTGRRWQPWVFLEKDNFIDKMAIKQKTKAIFNHRKNAYVLAENFQKYKSVTNARFVISQPKLDSLGHLKYTIRLKHG